MRIRPDPIRLKQVREAGMLSMARWITRSGGAAPRFAQIEELVGAAYRTGFEDAIKAINEQLASEAIHIREYPK